MHKPALIPVLVIAIFFLTGLTSCTQKVKSIHILTDRSELVSAGEIYNIANDDIVVTVHHVPGIDDRMIKDRNPDLVIGSFLSSPGIIDLLRPVETQFPVYEALEGFRDSKGRGFLTPLSFELSLIMGRREIMSTLPDTMIVHPEDLRKIATPYAARNRRGRLIRSGFSPAWNPQYYTDLLALRAPEFFAAGIGIEGTDEIAIEKIVEETRSWIMEMAGSIESDTAFSKRYRYKPDEYLLIDGRIRFARTDFTHWATLPDTISRILDIRYLSGPRKIPVLKVTCAGIPLRSSSPVASAQFIQWLMLPETQSSLLTRWERDGMKVFGFLGGLSSIQSVNESILVQHSPELKNMIPEGHYLQVPDLLPPRWPRIRDEVMIPWFQSAVTGTASGLTLIEAYRKWDLSSLTEAK